VQRWEQWSEGHQLAEVAVAAENAGFDMVSATDHPYPDAAWLAAGGHQGFELFTALAFMAAHTSRVRLLTYVLIAGYRNPYLAARAAATLDTLSGGRLTLGMGAGYLEKEFEVLGASFQDRGKRFDAAIGAMRNAWKGEVADYDDRFFPAHGAIMTPRPKQQPGPPIWIGGNSQAAQRRAAALGQGWMPFEQSPRMAAITKTPALGRLEDLAEAIERVKRLRSEHGNDEPFDVCFAPSGARDIDRRAESIAERIPDYEAAGITCLSYDGRARSWGDCMREIELMGTLIRDSR
jgi:probable F420-dependent oxidoreductase